MSTPLLQVDNLTRNYAMPREHLWIKPPIVKALQGVSFNIETGRSLGVVGAPEPSSWMWTGPLAR